MVTIAISQRSKKRYTRQGSQQPELFPDIGLLIEKPEYPMDGITGKHASQDLFKLVIGACDDIQH